MAMMLAIPDQQACCMFKGRMAFTTKPMSTTRRKLIVQALGAAGLISLTPTLALALPTFIITNVSQLNPVQVVRIAVPLSIEEIAREVKAWPGKVAVGGGRYGRADCDRAWAAP
jgi:hypothetical protein